MVQEINKDIVLYAEGLTFSYMDYEEGIKNVTLNSKKVKQFFLPKTVENQL